MKLYLTSVVRINISDQRYSPTDDRYEIWTTCIYIEKCRNTLITVSVKYTLYNKNRHMAARAIYLILNVFMLDVLLKSLLRLFYLMKL